MLNIYDKEDPCFDAIIWIINFISAQHIQQQNMGFKYPTASIF